MKVFLLILIVLAGSWSPGVNKMAGASFHVSNHKATCSLLHEPGAGNKRHAVKHLPVAPRQAADTIVIEADVSMGDNDYWVYIYRSATRIRLLLKVRDSVSSKLEADSEMVRCRRFIDTLQDMRNDSARFWQCVYLYKRLRLEHSYFTNVSLALKRKKVPVFDSLITAVFAAPDDSLSRPASSKNIVVLDGTSMAFSLTKDGKTRKVYARSPSPSSHLLLGSLIGTAMAILREKNRWPLPRRRSAGG